MTTPEPCLRVHCRSPVACGGWGYCRERNDSDGGAPSDFQIIDRRKLAGKAKMAAERGLTDAEKAAQGAACGCRGADDMCPCQNVRR